MPEQKGEVIDPFSLTLLYFERCGFVMGSNDESFICCRSKGPGGREADGRFQLSYQTAIKNGRDLLKNIGFGNIRYGSKSAKYSGATNANEKGVDFNIITNVGGWKTHGIFARYTHNSDDYKLKIAQKMLFK